MKAKCILKQAGLPYPRTCPVCKLGKCQKIEINEIAADDAKTVENLHKELGKIKYDFNVNSHEFKTIHEAEAVFLSLLQRIRPIEPGDER